MDITKGQHVRLTVLRVNGWRNGNATGNCTGGIRGGTTVSKPIVMSMAKWQKLAPTVRDISNELPDAFLMYGQWMRAKIETQTGEKFYATGWCPPGGKPYVELEHA